MDETILRWCIENKVRFFFAERNQQNDNDYFIQNRPPSRYFVIDIDGLRSFTPIYTGFLSEPRSLETLLIRAKFAYEHTSQDDLYPMDNEVTAPTDT